MAWYKTGTISVTTGQTSVTGVGTKFASNARVGDGFRGADGEWYEIVNIASETVLGIFPAYVGASASASANWMVAPLQGYNKESADRLRAITDNMSSTIESINNKQDKNTSLTAISNSGTPTTPSFVLFNANGTTASMQPMSDEGLLFVRQPNPVTMRARLQLGSMALADTASYPRKDQTGVGTLTAPNASEYDNPGSDDGGGFYKIGGGSSSSGLTYSSVIRIPYSPLYEAQVFFPMGQSSSKMFFRVSTGGSGGNFGTAYELYHTGNATKDPSVEVGLMSRSIVNGFSISKYANGQCNITGPLPVTPTIGAGAYTAVTATIPAMIIAGGNASIFVAANPSQSYDMYGITTTYENTASGGFISSIGYVVRNGNTAQNFGVRVSIWGAWK